MKGKKMEEIQCSLDAITPFQSALTPPFFPFIYHSLLLNYPSLYQPLLPSVCSGVFRLGLRQMGENEYTGSMRVKEG